MRQATLVKDQQPKRFNNTWDRNTEIVNERIRRYGPDRVRQCDACIRRMFNKHSKQELIKLALEIAHHSGIHEPDRDAKRNLSCLNVWFLENLQFVIQYHHTRKPLNPVVPIITTTTVENQWSYEYLDFEESFSFQSDLLDDSSDIPILGFI